jgi:hypothetical protein
MCVVDTRHVDRTGRLVVFGRIGERIDVDTFIGGIGVMLVRLNKSEISSITFRETVMTIKLKLGRSSWVLTIVISTLGREVAVVKIFVRRSINIIVTSNNPNNFLTRMVKVELDLVGKTRQRFFSLELKLFNEVFVLSLSKSSTFIGIKKYVVDKQTGISKRIRCTVG